MPNDTPVIKKIEQHLNNTDKIREDVKVDIDKIFQKINVKNFITNPANTADALIFSILQLMVKKYIKAVITESKGYAKDVIDSQETL